MIKPGRYDPISGFAVDQRGAEGTIRMGPADQCRQGDAPAMTLDARGKKPEQTRRRLARPHESHADVTSEHGRSCKREGGFVEDVGFERAGCQRAPLFSKRRELVELPPLDTKHGIDRAVHVPVSALAGAAPDENMEAEPVSGNHE